MRHAQHSHGWTQAVCKSAAKAGPASWTTRQRVTPTGCCYTGFLLRRRTCPQRDAVQPRHTSALRPIDWQTSNLKRSPESATPTLRVACPRPPPAETMQGGAASRGERAKRASPPPSMPLPGALQRHALGKVVRSELRLLRRCRLAAAGIRNTPRHQLGERQCRLLPRCIDLGCCSAVKPRRVHRIRASWSPGVCPRDQPGRLLGSFRVRGCC